MKLLERRYLLHVLFKKFDRRDLSVKFIKCDPTSKIAPYRNYVQSSGNKITAIGMDYGAPITILIFHNSAKK